MYAAAGARRQAQNAHREYLSADIVDPWQVAYFYMGEGDEDQAVEWLTKAYEQRSANVCLLKVDPWFDPLRSDPRFQDLLRRMNFPP